MPYWKHVVRLPVVCGNTTSLPEIVGDAGLLIDPLSLEEQAAALSRVLIDTELRKELIARGRVRPPSFPGEIHLSLIRIISQPEAGFPPKRRKDDVLRTEEPRISIVTPPLTRENIYRNC